MTPILIEAFKEFIVDYKQNQVDIHSTLDALRQRVDSLYEQKVEEATKNSLNTVYPVRSSNNNMSKVSRCCQRGFQLISCLLLVSLVSAALSSPDISPFFHEKMPVTPPTDPPPFSKLPLILKIAIASAKVFMFLVVVTLTFSACLCCRKDDIEVTDQDETPVHLV